MNGVPFLPQKFPVAQERPGSLLPTQDAAPLIILHGKVPVGLKHMGKMLAEKGLRGRPDGIPFLQLVHTAMGDPRALRGKPFHMILLFLQKAFRNQQGHINIFNALFFEFLVQNILNILPDGIPVGAVNKHALDGRIVDQLCLGAHIGKPLGEIDLHIGDLLHLFLLGHIESSPLIGFVG